MTILYSPATGGFYDTDLGGQPPADGVEVTAHRHRCLVEARAQGRVIVAGEDGRPLLAPVAPPALDALQAAAVERVKGEARRRILELAPLWVQNNDNAAIARLSWRDPESLAEDEAAELAAALGRRASIDALRAASDVLELAVAGFSAEQLDALEVAADAHWPAG